MTTDTTFLNLALSARIDSMREDWSGPAIRRSAQAQTQANLGRASANELADLGISSADQRR